MGLDERRCHEEMEEMVMKNRLMIGLKERLSLLDQDIEKQTRYLTF